MKHSKLYIFILTTMVSFTALAVDAQQPIDREYTLGVGDRLRVIVYGEDDLSGEFEVGSQGTVNLPLIGEVIAAGSSVSTLEDGVELELMQGYLKSPTVSIEVLNYRPFYILGEVNEPGSYPYINGITVLNAVALAGGFTYRADDEDILLSRSTNGEQIQVTIDTPLLPGDIVRVEERFF
jgi:protein involved in polysaccharide export with SLBB domain